MVMKTVYARTEDLHENGGCGLAREIYATISLYSKLTNARSFHVFIDIRYDLASTQTASLLVAF